MEITTNEAGKRLGVTPRRVRRLCRDGRIDCRWVGQPQDGYPPGWRIEARGKQAPAVEPSEYPGPKANWA